jgi:hypothetical protein
MRINLFTPDYRIGDSFYNETSRRKFRWGVLKFSILFGFIGAFLLTDNSYLKNDLNLRPDLNTMRNLVNLDHVPIKEKKVFEMMYGNYFGMPFKEKNRSVWKRFMDYFYPYNDYKPDRTYCEPFFDYKKDYVTNNMKNHYHFDI